MIATFSKKIQLSTKVWEFYLNPTHALDYQPGQYVEVRLPNVVDPRGASRIFTLTSLPNDPYLSFAVKFPDPHTDYKQGLLQLSVGDSLDVSQAMGDLVLPRDKTRPLVFIAGGLGIASFVGMCKWLTMQAEVRNITLHYAIHAKSDELFGDIISECPGLRRTTHISPKRLSTDDIVTNVPPETLYYISGSEPFTIGLKDNLLSHGISPTNIVYDFFDGYKPSDV